MSVEVGVKHVKVRTMCFPTITILPTGFTKLHGSVNVSLTKSTTFILLMLVGFLAATSAVADDGIQYGIAGADAGEWLGKKGAVIGPVDDACAKMGATGDVNLVSDFHFNLPVEANTIITGFTFFSKAGAAFLDTIHLQLASNASSELDLALLGTERDFIMPDISSGICSQTIVRALGGDLASWGIEFLDVLTVNSPNFGVVLTRLKTNDIQVDSICLEIAYTTDEPAVQETCFARPTEDVFKDGFESGE